MKKNLLTLVTVLALTAILFSCNNGLSGDAYTIKMRMHKADTFHNNIRMGMNMQMKMANTPIDMNMKMDANIKLEVMDSTAAGKELKLTYNSLHMSMDMGNKAMDAINSDSIMNASAQKVTGKSVLLELSPTNEITGVKGFDSLMVDNSDDEASKKMMEQMFSKEQMNSLFSMMFSMYPSKPVKVGETWTATTKVNLANIDMKVKMKYTLAGIKNGLADIDVDGVIDGKGEMKQAGMAIGISMSGTQKGTLTIKMEDGYLKNGGYKMDVKAEMEMMGQKIPMTIKADYYINDK